MADKKETKVMVVPADMPESHLRGMGWAGETADYRVWGATLPADSDHVAIARLFAGLMLADQEKILIPQDINPGAIPLQLLADGSLRFSRGKRFTPWACGEIERIARVMMAEQPAYIREVQLALNYKSAVFTRPPQSFVYQDEHGVARVGPAPAPIPVEVERSDRVLHGLQGYSLVRACAIDLAVLKIDHFT